MIRCGNPVHKNSGYAPYHEDIATVRACFATPDGRMTCEEEHWTDLEIQQEQAAERATERFYEEGPHGGYYAGSEEESRDRFYDSLLLG